MESYGFDKFIQSCNYCHNPLKVPLSQPLPQISVSGSHRSIFSYYKFTLCRCYTNAIVKYVAF